MSSSKLDEARRLIQARQYDQGSFGSSVVSATGGSISRTSDSLRDQGTAVGKDGRDCVDHNSGA
jgi:hypothetical protein